MPYSSIEQDILKVQQGTAAATPQSRPSVEFETPGESQESADATSGRKSDGQGSVRRSRSLRKLLFSGSGKWSRSPMRRSRSWLRGSQARSPQAERFQAVGFFDEAGRPAELDPPSRGVNGQPRG